jgi:hypothetical protein
MKKLPLLIVTFLLKVVLLAQSASDLQVQDTRDMPTSPSSYTKVLQAHFKYHNAVGIPYQGTGYSTILGLRGWTSDNSGGKAYELAFSDDNQIRFRSGYSPSWEAWRRVITEDHNGNVGIGTTDPQAKVDVKGLFYLNRPLLLVDQLSTLGVPDGSYLGIAPTNLSPANNSYMLFSFPTNSAFRIGTNYDGHLSNGYYRDIEFGRYSGDPYMVVKDGGNVGIGTCSPQSKLTVAGDMQSRKVKVSINVGADFVFEEDYDLKKLDELQKYIQQHKHLPEIPSAKEMETKGIELGEMSIKLLQKIEELTLYMIELKKENEKIKEQMVEQQKEIQFLKATKTIKQ